MYCIGYDVGSSSVKACLLDIAQNQIIASAQYPDNEMAMVANKPGWAEQDPAMWWQAIIEATHRLKDKTSASLNDVSAIGISYQMHGLVIVDQNHQVLRPSIIWCDSRAVPYGQRAFESLGTDYCQNHLLNSPGNFTASKLAWVSDQEPKIYESVNKLMLPGDYIAMKLSGATTTTHSGLSEGIFYDFVKDKISPEVLEYFAIDRSLIPTVVPTFGEQCRVDKRAARLLGIKEGTPITYRAGDQPNNALALNVTRPGELATTAGTSGVVYGVTELLENDPLFRVNAFAHVNHTKDQRRLGILLCINGTGILNSWTKKILGLSSYEEMNKLAESVSIGSDGLSVLPFGNGAERILENRNIGSMLHGLQFNTHRKAHISRAVQEGIACSFRYGTDLMKKMGVVPDVIRAGRANLFLSDLFQEAVANLTGATIELYDTDGSHGAARGAGIGLGVYTESTAFEGLQLLKRIEPKEELRSTYEETFQKWKKVLLQEISD